MDFAIDLWGVILKIETRRKVSGKEQGLFDEIGATDYEIQTRTLS